MTYLLHQYDAHMRSILAEGFHTANDRTGKGTLTKFGLNMEIDISDLRVPILTKRAVQWKSIVKEVLWYISGSHMITDLENMGAKIWTPWKSKEFTDRAGLPEGSGGYVYGFNLIHFGADINELGAFDSIEQAADAGVNVGFNQLDYVINTLRSNPNSRQACFTFWRPDTNTKAILPACHAFYTFMAEPTADGTHKLNVHLYQRSADWPVGVGMGNLFTAALFLRLVAIHTGMLPGKIYYSGGNCHVYMNAVESMMTYLSRDECPESPTLLINTKPTIYDYTIDDFNVVGYAPLEKIVVPIAV